MKWILERWQAKLIALVLAVSVYLFTGTQITVENTVTIPVSTENISNLPTGYIIIGNVSPPAFDVTIAGPMTMVSDLSSADIRPVLEIAATSLPEGRQEFAITEQLLGLPPQLSLRSTTVETVSVNIGKEVEDVLRLDDRPEIVGLAEGLRASVALVRSRVLVRGPRSEIDALKTAGTVALAPLDLSEISADIAEERTINMPLQLAGNQVSQVEVQELPEAIVTITPEPAERTIGPLTVQVLAQPDFLEQYEIELSPAVIALKITGPANRMAEANLEEQVRVYVDMTELKRTDASIERVIRVVAPAWAIPAATAPVQVTVRLRGDPTDTQPDPESDDPPPPAPQPNEMPSPLEQSAE